jgi:YD repeat-containing protein
MFGRQIAFGRTIVVPDALPASGTVDNTLSVSGLLLDESFDDGFSAHYDHDAMGRVFSISSGGAALWTADEIDAAGRVVREHYGNGRNEAYTYDQLGMARTITLDSPTGSGSLYDVTVTRNSYGAPTLIVDNDQQGADHNATFGYDAAGRLTESTLGKSDPQHPEQQFRFSFRYDALQNMTLRTVSGPQDLGVLVGRYVYGERGYGPRQLTSVVP